MTCWINKLFIVCNENIWESLSIVINQTYIYTTIKDKVSCYSGFYLPSITFVDSGYKTQCQFSNRYGPEFVVYQTSLLLRSLNTGARSIMSVTHYDSTPVSILIANYYGLGSDRWRLTHLPLDKMADIFRTTFSNGFSWTKMYKFRLRFHLSLFPGVQLTTFQHWFRWWLGAGQATSHYMNQRWIV